jgi:hypothetical protein
MPPDREGFGESRSPPEAETIISSAAASQPRTNGWVSVEGIEASRANCTRGLWPGPVPQGSAIPLIRSSARMEVLRSHPAARRWLKHVSRRPIRAFNP